MLKLLSVTLRFSSSRDGVSQRRKNETGQSHVWYLSHAHSNLKTLPCVTARVKTMVSPSWPCHWWFTLDYNSNICLREQHTVNFQKSNFTGNKLQPLLSLHLLNEEFPSWVLWDLSCHPSVSATGRKQWFRVCWGHFRRRFRVDVSILVTGIQIISLITFLTSFMPSWTPVLSPEIGEETDCISKASPEQRERLIKYLSNTLFNTSSFGKWVPCILFLLGYKNKCKNTFRQAFYCMSQRLVHLFWLWWFCVKQMGTTSYHSPPTDWQRGCKTAAGFGGKKN